MNVKMEKLEKNVVKLEIIVEAEKFNEALKKSFAKNAKKFNIPGFRKGKAPLNIVKKYYGEGVLFEDAIDMIYRDTYPKALEENNINPIDYPSIDIVQIGEGKEFIYTAEITVMPEVELGEYKALEVKKNEYNVTDEDVENKLKEIPESEFKSVYFELASQGPETYGNSYGDSLWGNILKTAKCSNIAQGKITDYGPLNPEYVISSNPQLIIFSGQTNSKDQGKQRFEMGFDVKSERALETMNMYLKRPGWENLNAVKDKEIYGVDHSGLRTLYDYVYLQYIAKVIHPEKFTDVDPLANLNDFYTKYLPVKPEGTFMIKEE